jgi:WD repeat-containing protein 48
VLEPYNCFDAEMYADELVLEEPVEFREDQRSTFQSGLATLKY